MPFVSRGERRLLLLVLCESLLDGDAFPGR